MPRHAAIIMDGNGRWAQQHGLPRLTGHRAGTGNIRRVVEAFAEAGYDGWAVLEWECCIKGPDQGAAEAVPFILDHIIETTDVTFDDFAGGDGDQDSNREILGLG